jgi:hypothetical protein
MKKKDTRYLWNFVTASAAGEVTKIYTGFSVLLPGNGQHGECEGASVRCFHSNRDLDYRFIGYVTVQSHRCLPFFPRKLLPPL